MPELSQSTPLTLEDALERGGEALTDRTLKDTGGFYVTGAHLARPGDICYTGPCIAGTVNREVWYFDNNLSCSIMVPTPDHACGA